MFEHSLNVVVSTVNPSQAQARSAHIADVDGLIHFIVEKVWDKIANLEDLPDYEVSVHSLDQIKVQFAPGTDLMAAWRNQRGQGYKPLPPELLRKRCCINPESGSDPRCFAFAVLAYFVRGSTHDPQRMEHYVERVPGRQRRGTELPPLKRQGLNFDGLDWRKMNDEGITLFEQQNPTLGIFTYSWLNLQPQSIRSPDTKVLNVQHFEHEIKLLLFEGHYSLISNWDRFASRRGPQTRGLNYHRHVGVRFCHRCTQTFHNEEQRNKHLESWCLEDEAKPVTWTLPPVEDGPTYARIKAPQHLHMHPARIFADFGSYEKEGVNRPISVAWTIRAHGWRPRKVTSARTAPCSS